MVVIEQAIDTSPIKHVSKDIIATKKKLSIKESFIKLVDRFLHPDILG